MNVLILTNPNHEDFVYETLEKANYRGGLIITINNKGDFEKFTNSFSYDIGVSFMYQHKVPAKEVNSHTWFNFHPAPLPEYKGRNLCYHAIMNGETEFGASLHYMDENFDTGDIIYKIMFPVLPSDTAEDVSRDSIIASKDLFVQYFPRIIAGEHFERLPNVGGTYYKKEAIDEIINFDDGGHRERKIRAITCGDFYPKVNIGGVTYKIVRDE